LGRWQRVGAAEVNAEHVSQFRGIQYPAGGGTLSNRRLAPIPYSVAAICLHIAAESGQLQLKEISFGDGNSPLPGWTP
jgi:hypothetical protein